MTVRELGVRVLQDLGVYGAGEVVSPEDMALFVSCLNDWIDALKTEHLSIYAITRQVWTLTAAASYTVGSGAVVNIDRPINPQAIENVGYQITTVTPVQEVLFGRPLTVQDFANIANKTLTNSLPTAWYYNPTFDASGFATLTPWPIPTQSGLQGVIYAPSAVSEFANDSVVIALPPGYRRFLRTNVAVEVAPSFSTEASRATIEAAIDSKGQVKRANERLVDVQMPDVAVLFAGGGPSNIYTGN